jgi:hypothetical protein
VCSAVNILTVMAGPVPAIPVFQADRRLDRKTWMAATRAAMTVRVMSPVGVKSL